MWARPATPARYAIARSHARTHALTRAAACARPRARAQVEHTNGKRLTLKVESKKKLSAIGAQVRALG